ncbi:MAG: CoA transferase [Acidimicrobiaceae bacterium]|nr:CoA transferase [Acidimicrobiaceae bacterium]
MADEKGELCGRILADLGADVVRLEPAAGAVSRRLPPRHGVHSLYFAVRNANKRGGIVDLDSEAGRGRLRELLRRADVWVESTRPSELASVGLDPAAVASELRHLVVTSITDFGQTGPYRDWAGTDAVLVALAGELFRSGTPDRPPLLVPGALAYDVAGIMGAFATLAAYWQRLRSGVGQHLDVSVLEATAQVTDWSLPNQSAARSAGRDYSEVRAGSGPVYPLYRCADGYVRLIILSPRQWRAMRAWLGEPEVLQDDYFDSLLARLSVQEDILDPMFEEFFATRGMAELADEAQRRGIVMTPVLDPASVLHTEHFAARGSFVDAEVAPGVRGPVASGFFEIDGERAGFRHRAPALGEHDADIEASWPDARDPAPGGVNNGLPFEGLLVLDFGHGGVGVEAGRLFAEYGADVIKVESRSYPDFIRLVAGSETSPSFASSSRSKRSLGVNIKTAEGRDLVRQLAARADLVIENNSTGTMDELGLGYETLCRANPGLVMVSSQLMGSRGPWASWLGYGPSTRPIGGMTWLWNFPDGGPPPGAGVIFPDHVAGRLCALAGAACLIGRHSATGTGAHIDEAQVETVLGMLADQFLREGLQPGSVHPAGNRNERGAPWGVYPCCGEQRWCVITCRDDDDWRRLRRALGDPPWAADPGLDGAEGRHARQDDIDRHLGEWTAERSDREVMELLQGHGVPAAMMAYASDQLDDPQLVERGYLVVRDQPGVGPMVFEGPAFHATGMSEPRITPAPGLGEHTRDIARELLDLDDEQIQKLVDVGVLEV